jgi:hypothetical protein
MKLWFEDDENRITPGGWTVARNVAVAKLYLAEGAVVEASFDHDIDFEFAGSSEGPQNGTDLVNWMIDALGPGRWPNIIWIHTHNRVAAKRMKEKLDIFKPSNCHVFIRPYNPNS